MRPSHQQAHTTGQPSGVRTSERISERHVRGVYHFMYRHVGNREEAEALTERACLLASQGRRASPSPVQMSLEERLSQIARSVVEDYLRAIYPTAQPLAGDDGIVWRDVSDRSAAVERADDILAQLSAEDREFLTCRLLRNDSLAETAARMRLTLAQAMALQWSALSHAARIAAQQADTRSSSSASSCGSGGELIGARC